MWPSFKAKLRGKQDNLLQEVAVVLIDEIYKTCIDQEVIKMIFEFGQYKVDIDIPKTKLFYEKSELVSAGCFCDGCRNFESAVDMLPQSIKPFFLKLGIDMKKICECYVNCTNEDGTIFYGGFYHICGTLLSGSSAWVPTSKTTAHWEPDLTFSISPDFHISFQDSVDLLEKDFPLPAIQLEISANIPWVLNKENPYLKTEYIIGI